jgi:molybdopterin/thiamine biosynthesis adenylyltransferase/rhodanese-related sulfurtransferase
MVDVVRFARHISLPEVGIEGQQRLLDSRVLIIGAGGLGSPVAMYLAAAGVGCIGLVDDDVVDVSNLQRQIMHSESTKGVLKVESAKERLLGLHPALKVETFPVRFDPDTFESIHFDSWDVIVDGTDNIPTRYFIDDVCRLYGKPWVYGSIFQFEGQVSVFNHENGPVYRDLFPVPPPPEAIPSCAEAGVFGVLPGVIGSLQATEVIKIIIGLGEVLRGSLLVYNGLDTTFRHLRFEPSDERPDVSDMDEARQLFNQACSPTRTANDRDLVQEAGAPTMFNQITAAEVREKRDAGWDFLLIDVRSPGEHDQARIKGNNGNIPHDSILYHLDEIPQDKDVVLHCQAGMRSEMAIYALMKEGFDASKLYNLTGGLMAWANTFPEEIEQ